MRLKVLGWLLLLVASGCLEPVVEPSPPSPAEPPEEASSPDEGEPAPVGCLADGTPGSVRVAAYAGAGSTVMAVLTDGSVRVAYQLLEVPGGQSALREISAVGSHALVGWTRLQPERPRVFEEWVLLDASGRAVWAGREGTGAQLREGGVVTMMSANDGLIIRPDGSEQRFPGELPLDAPGADGWLALCAGSTCGSGGWGPRALRFVQLDSGVSAPFAHSAAALNSPMPVGKRYVYYALDGARRATLVSERPGDVKAFTLAPHAGIVNLAGQWVLEASGVEEGLDSSSVRKLNLETGAIVPLKLAVPAGHRDHPRSIQVDSDGALLAWFDGKEGTAMFRSTDEGASWVQLSHGLKYLANTYGRYSTAQSAGGTFLVTTVEQSSFFGGGQTGHTRQVLRPRDRVQLTLGPAPKGLNLPEAPLARVSQDGHCVLYWEQEVPGGTTELALKAVDTRTGRIQRLQSVIGSSVVEPAWLEAP